MKIEINIENEKIKCPLCDGSGEIEEALDELQIKEKTVIELYYLGFSYRKICKIVGYVSTRSIGNILEKYKIIARSVSRWVSPGQK